MIGAAHSHGGSFATRASFAYGKPDTMATASTATAATATQPGRRRPINTPAPRTAAVNVVGTPVKKRPSLGETLKRASRIIAPAATIAQARPINAVGALPC